MAMCFSQGCSLVASLLLQLTRDGTTTAAMPFRGVVFICGGVPLGVLEGLGLPVGDRAWEVSDRSGRELRRRADMAPAVIERLMMERVANGNVKAENGGVGGRRGLWDDDDDDDEDEIKTVGAVRMEDLDRKDVFGLDFESFPDEVRIKVPTLHVVGQRDPRWGSGVQLALLCVEGDGDGDGCIRRVYDHGGGHDVPRTTAVSARIAEEVEWLVGVVRRREM